MPNLVTEVCSGLEEAIPEDNSTSYQPGELMEILREHAIQHGGEQRTLPPPPAGRLSFPKKWAWEK